MGSFSSYVSNGRRRPLASVVASALVIPSGASTTGSGGGNAGDGDGGSGGEMGGEKLQSETVQHDRYEVAYSGITAKALHSHSPMQRSGLWCPKPS